MKTYIINVQNKFSFKEVIKTTQNLENYIQHKISIEINFVFEIPTKEKSTPTN